MRNLIPLLIAISFVAAMFGCSNSDGPLVPEEQHPSAQAVHSHQLWGLWQFIADPESGTLDVTPIRIAEMHLNALPFLEPPVLVNLTLESLEFNGNIIEADIGIKHPFLGLSEFTGFDVCGILITNGSVSGFDDTDLIMAGEGDTRLLNPDGWSRWWNPSEFPVNEGTMFSYNDGLLGTPDSVGNYSSTLNAYKFFCDDLSDPDVPVDGIDITSRCIFSAGQKNIRHYTIEIGDDGLIFNYAIDANWEFPQGPYPWQVPDDFSPNANRVEAWNISITESENTLWNDGDENGGDLSLLIDVWDHYDADLNTVKIESSGNFDTASSAIATGGGEGYSTYQIDIVDATPAENSVELFITVESEVEGYQNLLPGETVSAYFMGTADVADESPAPPECGTGIYSSAQQTQFLDHSGANTVKFELAWLVTGTHAGQMLVNVRSGSSLTIRRYDMDTIGHHNGQLFTTLPPGTCPATPNPFLYHMEVELVTGRLIVVPNGLGINNSILIYDDGGNLLSPDTGISVGPSRRIMAMEANENGDLWLLTALQHSYQSFGDESRLECWKYQADSPYYVYDPTFDFPLDELFGYYYNDTWGYVIPNEIIDMVILYPEQRMFIFREPNFGQYNGKIDVFEINTDAPPVHLPGLSIENLFSLPAYNSHNVYLKITSGGIWCDHSDPELDGCRILVYGRSTVPMQTMLARLDRDANVLNESIMTHMWAYTIGINQDPDPAKANLVFVGYSPSTCYMSAPPADW